MAFNHVEMAILSQLSYYDLSNHPNTLLEFLEKNENDLRKKLGSEYTQAINNLKAKLEANPTAYKIVAPTFEGNGTATGFSAMAISGPTDKDVTVACRGTQGFDFTSIESIKDMSTDAQLALSLMPDQYIAMQLFMKELQKGGYDNYYFTGHSLGGNLAMYGAMCLEDPDKLGGVVTFNAPGFNADVLRRNQITLQEIEDRFVNYQNERDPVSSALTVPGKIVILECKGDDSDDIWGIDSHSLNALVINGDNESFEKNETGVKDPTIVGVGLEIASFITDLLLFPDQYIQNFLINVYKKLKEIGKKFSKGAKYAEDHQVIKVDTYKLYDYARRINDMNNVLDSLNKRMDKMYKKLNLGDKWDLQKADMKVSYSYRLQRCSLYLTNTADSFTTLEKELLNTL